MQRALVTGAAGFVGRHVAQALGNLGYELILSDVEPMTTVPQIKPFIGSQHVTFWGDAHGIFTNPQEKQWEDIALVIHCAAAGPNRLAIDTEYENFAYNVALDAAMFRWAMKTRPRRVIYLSSSAVYPPYLQNHRKYDLTENMVDPDAAEEPDSVYGWTKLTGERLAWQARRAGLNVTVVRPFSGYGEDQSEEFPFRALVERARRREDPFHIWGSGRQVRDWIHIADVVAGMLAAASFGVDQPVNICTGRGLTVTEIAQLACDVIGYRPIFEYQPNMPGGVLRRVGDPRNMFRYYRPVVQVEDVIKRMLQEDV